MVHGLRRLSIRFFLQPSPNPAKWIVESVHHPLLQGNDRIVGNLNALRTNFRAALRNIAVTDALRVSQFINPVFSVEWVHIERGHVNQKARSDKLLVFLMIAQDMANVLTQEALDAFPEFLDAIDVYLRHSPGSIGRIGRSRFELPDFFLYPEIPGNIRDQILENRKRFHRLDCDRFVERQLHDAQRHRAPGLR